MPERVVDVLEVIEVEEQHREARSVATGMRHRAAHRLDEHPAIRQPGERVLSGHAADAPLRLLALADVAQRRQHGVGAAEARGAHADLRPEKPLALAPAVPLEGLWPFTPGPVDPLEGGGLRIARGTG